MLGKVRGLMILALSMIFFTTMAFTDDVMKLRKRNGEVIHVTKDADRQRIKNMDGELVGYLSPDNRVKDRDWETVGYLERE